MRILENSYRNNLEIQEIVFPETSNQITLEYTMQEDA